MDEEKSHQDSKRFDRRQVLSSAGIAALGIVPTQSALAKKPSDSDKKYKAALKARRRTGSREKFLKILRNEGFRVAESKKTYYVTRDKSNDTVSVNEESQLADDSGGEFSTETTYRRLEETQITGWITYSYGWTAGEVWADFQWEHYLGDASQGEDIYVGDEPRDAVGIYWTDEDFDKENGSYYTGHHACTPESGSTCGDLHLNGVACEYDDVGNYSEAVDKSNRTMGSDMGLKLYQQDDDVRSVQADYIHTYSGSSLDIAVSVSPTPGLVLDPDQSVNSWKVSWEKQEN